MLLSSSDKGTYLEITESLILIGAVILHDLLTEPLELSSILIKRTLSNAINLFMGVERSVREKGIPADHTIKLIGQLIHFNFGDSSLLGRA